MRSDRRIFLKTLGLAGAGAALPEMAPASGAASHRAPAPEAMGVLVDTSYCVGCRKCEWACQETHTLPGQHIESFHNAAEFDHLRRPSETAYTVVNAYPDSGRPDAPSNIKFQCMHCVDPACVSACIVGALTKDDSGPVNYDAGRCMGCRYCLVACPFQIPAYEYGEALTPRVMKCTLCVERTVEKGVRPACVEICPEGCLIYGKRSELLAYAHRRIATHPERYFDHVFGENEVGGTSWLYLAARPLTELGFPELGDGSLPHLTERVQHAIFKNFFPPLALFAVLGGIMWLNRGEGDES